MYVLDCLMPTDGYIREVYETYFHSGVDGELIRTQLIRALTQFKYYGVGK